MRPTPFVLVLAAGLSVAETPRQPARVQQSDVIGAGVHADDIEGVAFSRDGKLLATADNGGRIAIWDAHTRRFLRALSGTNFTEVAFTPAGDRVAGAGFDGSVRVWDTATGRLIKSWPYPGAVETI